MTVGDAIERFLAHCKYEKNLSVRTLRAYSADLRQFTSQLPHLTDTLLLAIGKPELRDFLQLLSQDYQPKSIRRKVATLKAVFRFLELEEVILESPFRKMDVRIKVQATLPRTLSIGDIDSLIQYFYLQQNIAERTSKSFKILVRDIAIFETLFATGARVFEICNLRSSDVNLADGWLRITGKGGKERIIQLCNSGMLSALSAYCTAWDKQPEPNHFFFVNTRGARISEQSVRQMLARHSLASGMKDRVRPHLIRHSVATLLLEEGVDIRHIQALLGHSSIATTQIYTHVNPTSQRQVLSAKHPRNKVRPCAESDSCPP